ncbi:iron-containing alcohol dehydrogenase [Sediminibacillus massiliensis]|uniref:iron-containing alcohol dehydrogenase n=1 Tax=Sediminibacillus massiliensis TaxID=1926277 RepID=UPI00098854EC|nr:iron-containing alcohol dehydrogenase [Sediminibacillus massiliensis]
MDYKFNIPTRIESGISISKDTGKILKSLHAKQVFLVTDKGIRNAGILDGIEDALNASEIVYEIFDDVIANPTSESMMVAAAKLKGQGADHVLAVGGGSSIDTAKGVAVMATNEGNILDYEGVNKIPNQSLPLTVIPTTAGTGSEVTASTIVTNKETHFKAAVISPYLFPRLALLDPELTVGLPQSITAATGMDALTHAIESYTSKTTNPVSEALAIKAISMISANISKAYFVGSDLDSRESMLTASMLAGAAFSQSRLGNVHAISHTLGGVYDIPHGIANATLLPFVMNYNLPACPEKFADIANALGDNIQGLSRMEAARKAVTAVIQFNNELDIPDNIKELGVELDALPKLVEDSMRSGNVLINPRLTTPKDIETIIKNAYYGRLE